MKYDSYAIPVADAGLGKSLILLGQSEDGPVNTPIPVRSHSDARQRFGTGNLLDAYEQVMDVPNISVSLMRVTGEYARLSLLGKGFDDDPTIGPVLSFRSIHAGERYNSIRIYIQRRLRNGVEKPVLIIEPPSVDEVGMSYVLSDYPTIHALVYAINQDTQAKRNWVFASSPVPFADPRIMEDFNTKVENMSGGDNGLDVSKDDLYIALNTSYSILEGQEVDVVCPYFARLDDTHPHFFYGSAQWQKAAYSSNRDYLGLIDTETQQPVSFHEQLIEFCKAQEQIGVVTHGVMGLQEVVHPNNYPSYYLSRVLNASAFAQREGLVVFKNGEWHDQGHYLSVFAQDFIFPSGLEANGCALYAGLVASLNPTETTSNRPIPEDIELKFECEPKELRDLAFIGAVGARRSVKKGIVITNGVTAGLPNSLLSGIQNIRMIQFTLHVLNQVLEHAVGESFIPEVSLKGLEQQVEKALSDCVTLKIIKGYEFQVRFQSRAKGVEVDLSLMGRNTTEFIGAKASLRFDAGGVA